MAEYIPRRLRTAARKTAGRRCAAVLLPACALFILCAVCTGCFFASADSSGAETAAAAVILPSASAAGSVLSDTLPAPETETPETGTQETEAPEAKAGTQSARDSIRALEKEMTAPVLETTEELLQHRVELQLRRLSEYFADGSYWNHIGIDISGMTEIEQAMCVTDTPCSHSVNGYSFCNIYNGVMAEYFPQYDYETQCLGYASLISDLLFGLDAPVT
ncbi:MAG: hypothetical protein ACI4GO_03845, partial [Hominenteromicrobium sp.]